MSVTWALLLCGSGCGGDARVELAAADSMEALAVELELAVREYHQDLEIGDNARESSAIGAFVRRIRDSADDESEQNRHVNEFTAALTRVREDRKAEWERFTATLDNLDVLREVTGGVRRLAVESLAMQDEVRRYVHTLLEQRRAARQAAAKTPVDTPD